jgi:hypothetical protein
LLKEELYLSCEDVAVGKLRSEGTELGLGITIASGLEEKLNCLGTEDTFE